MRTTTSAKRSSLFQYERTCAEFLCGLNEGSLVPDPDDGLLNLDVEGLDGEGRVEGVSLLVSQGPEVRPSLLQLALLLDHVLRVGMVHVEQLMRQLIHHVHLAGVDVHLRLKTRESGAGEIVKFVRERVV